jgi:hypothetical protein
MDLREPEVVALRRASDAVRYFTSPFPLLSPPDTSGVTYIAFLQFRLTMGHIHHLGV